MIEIVFDDEIQSKNVFKGDLPYLKRSRMLIPSCFEWSDKLIYVK